MWLQLNRTDGPKTLVNLDNVANFVEYEGRTVVVYNSGAENSITVEEGYDKIVSLMIKNIEIRGL